MTARTGTYFSTPTITGDQIFTGNLYGDYYEGYADGYSLGFTTGLSNHHRRRTYYDDGYDAGRSAGFRVGLITAYAVPLAGKTYQDGYSDGFNKGHTQALSMNRGKRDAYAEGLDDGKRRGFMQGVATGTGLAPRPSATPPTVTVTSTPTTASDPIVIEIYDNVGLRFYHITCQDRTDGARYTVWDPHDEFFSFPFDNLRSTVTGTGVSTDPYIFTIYRLGGWPTGIALDIRVRAIDINGNETEE